MLVAPRYVPVAALACQPRVEIQPVSLAYVSAVCIEYLGAANSPAQELGMAFRSEECRPVILAAWELSET